MNRRKRAYGSTAAASATVLITAVTLTGCLAIPDSGATSSTGATSSAGASKTPRAAASPAATTIVTDDNPDLTFAAGSSIPVDAVTQWSDGLADEPDWRMSSPDDGHGSWAYMTVDGECVATFWQGRMQNMNTADDLAASDIVLATLVGVEPASLPNVNTGTFSHQISDHGSVDNRFMHGTFDDGMTWVLAARGFARTDSAVYVDVQCRGKDAEKVAGFVWNENAVRVG